MISPFRKKRQSLLKGKIGGRYFFYAISEVALVVVGILVALWINNWNEDQKLRKVEIDILKGIKSDLLQDTSDINGNMRGHELYIQLDSAILIHLDNRGAKSTDIVRMIAGSTFSELIIVLRRAYFEEAKVKGLSIISNKELRESISQLYEFHYPFLTDAENSLIMFDHYRLLNSALSDYFGATDKGVTISDSNYQKMVDNENVRFKFFTARSMSQGILNGVYKPIYDKVLTLIEDIDQELKVLEK